jgi:predicted negative regulator of RcsB-dependent stress response
VDNKLRRQLNQDDPLAHLTQGGVQWAGENRQAAILSGVIVVVLVLVSSLGYTWYQHRSAAAETGFGAAMQIYQTPVANAAEPTPPGMKTYPDAKARALAANQMFLDVAHQYGMTTVGKTALYFAGLTYMEAGETGPAAETLNKVAGSWDHPLAALAKMALAQLDQQTGHNDQAISLYQQLVKENASTVPSGLAQIQLAELYQAEGQTQKARDIYAVLKDKDKTAQGQPGPAGEIAAQKLNPQPQAAAAGPGPQ